MLTLALIFAIFVALLHIYIAYLEILDFGSATFCQIFKIAPYDLPIVKTTFNNLGIYNLAQSIFIMIGVLVHCCGKSIYATGIANGLLFSSLGTIVLAGAYLYATSHNKRRAAIFQAAPALLAILLLGFS